MKELATKTELNNAVQMPIFLLTTIISFHVFLFSKVADRTLEFIVIETVVNSYFIIRSLFFLNKSYFNLGDAFNYAEVAGMDKIFDHQLDLENRNIENHFNPYFERQLAKCAGINFNLNVQRTRDLAKAKKAIYSAIFTSLLASVIFIVSLLINK
ncbi:MAG: hypothetical protein V4565_09070 [Bacteroidota bacterium]